MVYDHDTIQQMVAALGNEKVLVPIARCSKSKQAGHIYINGLDPQDLLGLPRYEDGQRVNEDRHEDRHKELLSQQRYQSNSSISNSSIRSSTENASSNTVSSMEVPLELPVEQSLAVEDSAPLEGQPFLDSQQVTSQQTAHQKAGELVGQSDRPIQLYEERLVTNKQRVKTGEVKISKRTITDTSHSRIPITREKVIIEIESLYAGETRIDFGQAEVADDGTVRMDIYEDQAEVCRRVVPYQNVAIRKEIVEDTIPIQQTIRREELDVQATAPYVEITP